MNEPTDPLIVFADGTMGFKRDYTTQDLETSDWRLASYAECEAYAEEQAWHDPEHLAYLDSLCRGSNA